MGPVCLFFYSIWLSYVPCSRRFMTRLAGRARNFKSRYRDLPAASLGTITPLIFLFILTSAFVPQVGTQRKSSDSRLHVSAAGPSVVPALQCSRRTVVDHPSAWLYRDPWPQRNTSKEMER